jgi:hypothetical protein
VSKRAERKPPAPPKASQKAPERAGRLRTFLRITLRAMWVTIALVASAHFIVGLSLRLTVRDGIDALAVIFYAAPWPVLTVCGVLGAWYWRQWKKTALGVLLVSTGCTGAWLWTGYHSGPKDAGLADFRVAYWNCARPGWRLRGILPMAASWQADLLCFGESRLTGPLSKKWAEAFPEKRVRILPREMLLAGPENAELRSAGTLGGAGEFQLISTVLGGREVFILLVDFDGEVAKPREPAFERLCRMVDAFATKPLIVMGDFNTPADSVHFQRLLTRLTDAFQAGGTGFSATWPMVAPVLSLDHVLVNKHLRVVRAEHRTSMYSDHRAVIADLAWR